MNQVNILEAKTNLSKLILSLESNEYEYITIARNGKPVARLSLIKEEQNRRIGVAKGEFNCPEDFDWCNEEITELFEGGAI